MKKEQGIPRKRMGLLREMLIASAILSVAQVGAAGNTPITHCPFVIKAPGNYFLANDLQDCSTGGVPGVSIAASNVRLRLNGHNITLALRDSDAVGIMATGVQKVKIDGPGTISGFGEAIRWWKVDNSEVKGVTTSQNVIGFGIHASNNNRFDKNVASNNDSGIVLEGSNNNKLEDNVASNNGNGIDLLSSRGNELKGNTTNLNGSLGFAGCSGGGIELTGSSENRVEENTANGNCTAGIVLHAGSTTNQIEENMAFGNEGHDLADENPNCDANMWVENQFVTSNQNCIH